MRLAILALAGAISTTATANWQLANEHSSVHFISTKNTHVSELHHFSQMSGSLTDDGSLSITIDLASVQTGIEIRDTRMREKLFNVAAMPAATITANLDEGIMTMAKGTAQRVVVPATLSLNGQQQSLSLDLMVMRDANAGFVATSVAPVLLKATDFGLAEGLDVLQGIAGLKAIGHTVPVSVSVTFRAN
ncbi:YceI family protein [Aestuariibacter halophilus]|uniref:YceI family protein n=1 Tax=Fluctibacter halophilus TaxID=226011 RepID=A0ABS8G8X7_9ALTE|nr:YceI family protein [Aestuariibacter halophilus]MCC2617039.1 YceI family protein [Aestuariibacter halophilus]